jgi:Fe-S-cluster containining protein
MTVRDRVLAVYAEVDRQVAVAAPRCDASGRCCRFEEYGHTLFLSRFEAEILLETAPAYDKPVSRAGCPFQVDGLCTARDERPLGCRIYFCDPAYQTRQSEITEAAIADLKRIADETGTGWHYAPLHVFLNDAADRPHAKPPTRLPMPTRVRLPVV